MPSVVRQNAVRHVNAGAGQAALMVLVCAATVIPSAQAGGFAETPIGKLFESREQPAFKTAVSQDTDDASGVLLAGGVASSAIVDALIQPVSYGCGEDGRCGSDSLGWSGSEDCLVRLRAGFTQINKVYESHVGGTYGIDGVIPADDTHGAHWAARINQFSGGTQYLTSLGGWRRSNSRGDLSDRIGASLIVDLFHDSRASDLWLSQLRGQAGVATSETSAVGVLFTTALNDQRSGTSFVPGIPGAPFTAVDSIGMFATHELEICRVQASAGYRERPNSIYYDLALRRTLVDEKLYAYASTNYVADRGMFGTWIGLEYRLGGPDHGCAAESRRCQVWDDPVIFNAFNYGENSFWHNTNNPAPRVPDVVPE